MQGSLLRSGLHVVLAGQPNVGKSSLLNRLAGEEIAIVTAIPGTTRDAVRQAIQIEGVPINFVDTAGLRNASDEVERLGIQRTWDEIERADMALLLLDARHGMTPSDEAIAARLPSQLRKILVHNKIDLTSESPRIDVLRDAATAYVSAKSGAGIDLLRDLILRYAGWQASEESVFIARERHLIALRRAAERLDSAAGQDGTAELFAEELRLAQGELAAITGEFTADDLLGEIFARFCIGK